MAKPTLDSSRLLPLLLVAGFGLGLAGCGGQAGDGSPQLGIKGDEQDAAVKLGFPAIATKNTTRIGGGDPTADAAGVINAVFPAHASGSPDAVALVDADDWQAGIAASVLVSRPIGAPTLVTDDGELPPASEDTLERLNPKGSDLSKDAQVIRIGDGSPKPEGRTAAVIRGADPYSLAAAIDRFSAAAKGQPSDDVVVVSGERPDYAMPAAAWAARSGDSVLFARKADLPTVTRRALATHERPNIFLLGPEDVIGARVEKQLKKLGPVRRIEAPTAVENAIEFARYERAGFGWGITVPGQNFTVANSSRPLDAVASAPLASRGVFAPLLLTDRAEKLPDALSSYLLDVQPGYRGNPNAAVFNHVWILGDEKAVSIEAQARIDEISELVPIQQTRP